MRTSVSSLVHIVLIAAFCLQASLLDLLCVMGVCVYGVLHGDMNYESLYFERREGLHTLNVHS